jgi:SAM-dependent methyltransferase
VALAAEGRVLELGCGTGRVSLPLIRAGVDLVGVDRSAAMLARARTRLRARRIPTRESRAPSFVRGDIRSLPFERDAFALVLAPYGVLQSLTTPRDLTAALASAWRVLKPGATFGIELVPDVANWQEYTNERRLAGRLGAARLTLFESVRRDRKRQLTTFAERFVVRRGRQVREHRFTLVFRTLPMPDMTKRLRKAGFVVGSILGDYHGGPWNERADVWIILAKKV